MSDLNRRDVLGVLGASAAAVPALARALPIDGAMLPSGVSSTAFAAAVRELKAIVGPDNVFADAETILPYEKKFIPDTAKNIAPQVRWRPPTPTRCRPSCASRTSTAFPSGLSRRARIWVMA
jgi:hypothetical protein